ncbi:MAG: hypothetical protein M1816_006988 [Peltula sp. TS41687]|nr:MAG: hypothetical protein M1816_006988 [Peltula sp. TS41687]
MAAQLSPPGSSSYSSDTMHVGDGTWDQSRNTFLLPNLVGLNFATMRRNGMGNRFAGLPQYHNLIRGHGTVAAITFLVIVPSAILIARFYQRRPAWALRLHIWLQIITVALTTVVFILGWFAVGPNRSLTNPHHGIGLAIYVLILFQAIAGAWVHRREKGKMRTRIPLKLMMHQWLGRGIALLGIAQVALGLTLYGSPRSLFAIYSLVVFTLLVMYFILSYREGAPISAGHRSRGESTSEVVEDRRHRHRGLGALVGAGAAGAGLAALSRFRRRSRSRSPSRHHESRADVIGSRPPSESYVASEKYSRHDHHHDREQGNWRDRILKVGAVAGGVALAKRYMDRRRDKDRYLSTSSLGGPHGHTQGDNNLSRVEEGRPLSRIDEPPPHVRRSNSFDSSFTGSSVGSPRNSPRRATRHHDVREGVETLGVASLLRAAFKGRRERKEQRRIEQLRRREMEEERMARQDSQRQRYTGDGFPRRGGRRNSITTTDFTSPAESRVNERPAYPHGVPVPPLPTGQIPSGPVPTGPTTTQAGIAMNNTGSIPVAPVPMPAPPPDPQGVLHESSGSDPYVSSGGRQHRHRRSSREAPGTAAAAATVGAAAGLAAAGVASSHHHSGETVASKPVSVKVKLHSDGGHVTLRRLPEPEAATEREMRRRERSQNAANSSSKLHGRRRRGSESDWSGIEPSDRWRRVEDMERRQAEEMAAERQREQQQQTMPPSVRPVPPNNNNYYNPGFVPPPPPIPAAVGGSLPGPPPPPTILMPGPPAGAPVPGSMPIPPPILTPGPGPGSVGSPGTVTTEASNNMGGDYASRRQRRRAERAQAQAQVQQGGGHGPQGRPAGTVDFE